MLTLIDRLAGRWLDWRLDRATKHYNTENGTKFTKAEVNEFGVNVMLTSPGVAILAQEAAALLDAHNAKNYVEMDIMPRLDRGLRPVRLTVQWANGESPAQKASRLERELEQYRKEDRPC